MNYKILILSFFLSACATTYRISDIKNHVSELKISIADSIQKIDKDYQQKTQILDGLRKNKADFTKYPFNDLTNIYQKLTGIREQIISGQPELENYWKKFNQLQTKKEQLRKSNSEFKEVVEYKEFAENFKLKNEQLFAAYSQNSQAFNKTTQTNQIYFLNTRTLAQQL
ncbi:MAG: hypothetical protein KDD40_03665, partial [Bdellovibrionales bacterium]|nr:hypothetical protein [Bdellovibrionales bacterium]